MRYSIKIAKERFGKKSIIAAENGVWQGEFSKQIYKNLNIEKLFLIDSWRLQYRKEALEALSKTIYNMNYDNVYIMKMSSEMASKILNIEFDFVYLDNIHEPNYVFKEMNWWFKKIKKGGMLAGHDYTSLKPNRVKLAVEMFTKKYSLDCSYVENNPNEEVGDWIIWKQ